MAKMESDLESQMTAIRREHAKAIDSYVARDQAWQLEKEVIFTGVKIRDAIGPKQYTVNSRISVKMSGILFSVLFRGFAPI